MASSGREVASAITARGSRASEMRSASSRVHRSFSVRSAFARASGSAAAASLCPAARPPRRPRPGR
eukprot:8878497-Lingulodinium_polyedra.AAC.1